MASKDFPRQSKTVFPQAQVQLCMVHMVRHSLRYVSWKQRKQVAENLNGIYNAPTLDQAEANLTSFAAKWDASHHTIESLNMSLRKVTKNRGSFPNDEAMTKLLYLAMKNISKKWTMPVRG